MAVKPESDYMWHVAPPALRHRNVETRASMRRSAFCVMWTRSPGDLSGAAKKPLEKAANASLDEAVMAESGCEHATILGRSVAWVLALKPTERYPEGL